MNWDYIAGFFDGEGSIYLGINKGRNCYTLTTTMYQSKKEVLEIIKFFMIEEFKKDLKNTLLKDMDINIGLYFTKPREKINSSGLYSLTLNNKILQKLFFNHIKEKTVIRNESISYLLNNFNFINQDMNKNFDINIYRNLYFRLSTSRSKSIYNNNSM